MKNTSIGLIIATTMLSNSSIPAAMAHPIIFGSSGSSQGSHSNPTQPPTISEGLVVNLIGDLLGRGISDHVGVLTGDLGTMTSLGDGGEFAIIFGDSFRGSKFGQGEWMSPVGVVARFDEAGRIVILRPLNDGDRVEQLIRYQHNDRGLTLLPSDIINVDGTLYMQGMWNEGVGNVLYTQIWKSTDQGATWQSVSTTPAQYLNGNANLITWEKGPDGYIYMMSAQFNRRDDVYLTRFLPHQFGDRASWQHYSLNTEGISSWGTTATPILSENVRAGEMSLRFIDEHWVLAMFNAETAAIEIRISTDINQDWNDITPAKAVIAGNGGWRAEQNENNFTQLYGAYIAPGSTLDNMDLVISQWNTSNNSRYMSTQFNVKGLDTFFGITDNSAQLRTFGVPPHQVGNQDAITVEERPLDASNQQLDNTEKLMEDATDLLIVPLEQ